MIEHKQWQIRYSLRGDTFVMNVDARSKREAKGYIPEGGKYIDGRKLTNKNNHL